MGGLADISFGQIAAALGRYKPVVATVVTLILLLSVLPRHNRPVPAENASRVSPAKASTRPRAGSSGAGASAAPPVPANAPTVGDPAATAASSTVAFGDSSATPALASALTRPSSSTSYSDGGASSPTSYVSPPTSSAGTTAFDGAPTALTVRESAWSTQEAGTPLSADGVPAGTLPVGTRVGRDDKRSFVRLSGEDAVLRLTEDPAGARSTAGVAAVQACQITSTGWPSKTEMTMGSPDEPTWDANQCVAGTRGSDGTWTFDLARFATRTDGRGFALLPAPGGPIDAQVTFKVG